MAATAPEAGGRMIDQRFSRQAFESLRSVAERQLLARELAAEVRGHIEEAPDPDNGLSAVLARLRLIGHYLFPVEHAEDHVLYAGDPAGSDPPTGLELELRGDEVEARFRGREVPARRR